MVVPRSRERVFCTFHRQRGTAGARRRRAARASIACLPALAGGLVLLLAGCRPSAVVTYKVAGTAAAVYTRDAAFLAATFHGPSHWEILAIARITPAGAQEPVERRRTFESDDGRIEVRLADLMPNAETLADGRYNVVFYPRGVSVAHAIPQATVILDRTAPRIFRRLPRTDGAPEDVPLLDGAEIITGEPTMTLRVEDDTASTLRAGGKEVTTAAGGLAELVLGAAALPDVRLEAADAAGNTVEARIKVLLDRREPRLAWAGELERAVYEASPTLEFNVDDDTSIAAVHVRLNERDLPSEALGSNRHRVKLALEQGSNRISLEAIDAAGRRSVLEDSIEYRGPKPRVVWTIVGTSQPLFTRETGCRVARFESVEELEVFATGAHQLPPGATQPVRRRYAIQEGKLDVPLADFLPAEAEGTANGQYRISFAVTGLESGAQPPEAMVILDRARPQLLLEADGKAKRVDGLPAAESEIFITEDVFKLRVTDESPGPKLSLGGKMLEDANEDNAYWIPVRPEVMELVASDAAGNESRASLHLRRDREKPIVTWKDLPASGTVEEEKFTLQVRAEDDTALERVVLKLNGSEVAAEALPGGEHRAPLILKPGANELIVEAADRAGRVATEVRTLEFRRRPPAPEAGDAGAGPALVPRRIVVEGADGGGERFSVLIESPDGKLVPWVFPASVQDLKAVPGQEGKYLVVTATEEATPMALVRGACVRRAAGAGGDAAPVAIDPFLIDCTEVTVARYARFAAATARRWLDELGDEFRDREQPAVGLSWDDAAAFARWAGKELPVAAQWEAAAAWDGTGFRPFPWGDNFAAGGLELAWLPAPPRVTSAAGDVSPWGVAGMAGGTREWCRDETPGKPDHRVIRGGSAVHPRGEPAQVAELAPDNFLVTRETTALRTARFNDVGCRLVISLRPAGGAPAAPVSPSPEEK